MLNRMTTVATASVLALVAIPVVWSVGYQDHPWRQPALSIAAGAVLIGASIATSIAGSREDPPVSRLLNAAAIIAAIAALLAALFWALIG